MFTQIGNSKKIAYVGKVRGTWTVTIMTDDGFEDILDCRHTVRDEADGEALLLSIGYEKAVR